MDVMPKLRVEAFRHVLEALPALAGPILRKMRLDQLDELISFQGRTDLLNDAHVNILEFGPRSFWKVVSLNVEPVSFGSGSDLNIVIPRFAQKMRCVHH